MTPPPLPLTSTNAWPVLVYANKPIGLWYISAYCLDRDLRREYWRSRCCCWVDVWCWINSPGGTAIAATIKRQYLMQPEMGNSYTNLVKRRLVSNTMKERWVRGWWRWRWPLKASVHEIPDFEIWISVQSYTGKFPRYVMMKWYSDQRVYPVRDGA